VKTDSAGDPGVFDVTGKTYTSHKLRDLFDLQLLNPDGVIPEGADVIVRLGPETALLSP
jgi:hypothetical protein